MKAIPTLKRCVTKINWYIFKCLTIHKISLTSVKQKPEYFYSKKSWKTLKTAPPVELHEPKFSSLCRDMSYITTHFTGGAIKFKTL